MIWIFIKVTLYWCTLFSKYFIYINSASPAYHRHKCTFRFILSVYEIAVYICRSIRMSISY